jgi:hypothetical protein
VFFYADDMELFLPVRGIQDCLKIQSDLSRLVDWYGANSLELNVGKCKSITFSRLRHPVEFSYMLALIVLTLSLIWVVMDSRMSFSGHIDVMGREALAMLGFVKRLLDPYNSSTQIVYGGLFMTCTSIGLSMCT